MVVYSKAHQKTDVAEHSQVFLHIGLLFNEPPGDAELLFIQSSENCFIVERRINVVLLFLLTTLSL